jgi:hypothetical protein
MSASATGVPCRLWEEVPGLLMSSLASVSAVLYMREHEISESADCYSLNGNMRRLEVAFIIWTARPKKSK